MSEQLRLEELLLTRDPTLWDCSEAYLRLYVGDSCVHDHLRAHLMSPLTRVLVRLDRCIDRQLERDEK